MRSVIATSAHRLVDRPLTVLSPAAGSDIPSQWAHFSGHTRQRTYDSPGGHNSLRLRALFQHEFNLRRYCFGFKLGFMPAAAVPCSDARAMDRRSCDRPSFSCQDPAGPAPRRRARRPGPVQAPPKGITRRGSVPGLLKSGTGTGTGPGPRFQQTGDSDRGELPVPGQKDGGPGRRERGLGRGPGCPGPRKQAKLHFELRPISSWPIATAEWYILTCHWHDRASATG